MRYIFLFLLIFFLIIVFYAVYLFMPSNTSEYVDELVYNTTGHRRVFLPEKVKKELDFLKFDKMTPEGVKYIYYYSINESDEKRLAIIITDRESKISIDGTIQENIISESDMSRIYSIKIPEGSKMPVIVHTYSKPEAYIGSMTSSI